MNGLNKILYRGIEHEVRIISYPGKNSQVIYRENTFCLYINNKLNGNAQLNEARNQIKDWMIAKAGELLRERTAYYGKLIGVEYNNVRIKDTKTRWGSCSSKKNLNFSFRIIMAPERVMDYVVIHELCHLRHMNHKAEFWNLVAQHIPDYEEQKAWLKFNGLKLHLI